MKNSHQSPISSPIEVVGEESSEKTINVSVLHKQVAEVTTANNPKIDHRLLAEYERLISASKDVVSVKKTRGGLQLSSPTRIQGQAYGCLSPRTKGDCKQNKIIIIKNQFHHSTYNPSKPPPQGFTPNRRGLF